MADSGYWQSDQSGWFNSPQQQQDQSSWSYAPGSQQYSVPDPNNPYYSFANSPASGGYYSQQPAPQYGGDMFLPSTNMPLGGAATSLEGGGGFEDEKPLLEELGINFDHIRQKTLAVLNPFQKPDASAITDQDLAGPLVFCLLFGGALLLHGKMHFGYIYGIGALGCLGMFVLLNLMTPDGISLTCTVSVLGYCLLPMALLSLLAAVVSFQGAAGLCVAGLAVLWCSVSAAKLFVTALSMDHQQFLVAYPCCLVYGVFALLAIF